MYQIISLLWVIHVRIGVKCTIVMCLAQVSVCLVLKVFYVVNWSVLLNLKKKILTINLDFAQITIRVLRITLGVFYSRKPFIVVENILSDVWTVNWHVIRNCLFCICFVVEAANTIKSIGSVRNVQGKPKKIWC